MNIPVTTDVHETRYGSDVQRPRPNYESRQTEMQAGPFQPN